MDDDSEVHRGDLAAAPGRSEHPGRAGSDPEPRSSTAPASSSTLWGLTHLRFDESAAVSHWRRIALLQVRDVGQAGSAGGRAHRAGHLLPRGQPQAQEPDDHRLTLLQRTQARYRDDLTRLYNYRYLREYLVREIDRVGRTRSPASLLLLDLDDFKQFNDRYGHVAGNHLLVRLGRLLRTSMRKVDIAARYGRRGVRGHPARDAQGQGAGRRRAIRKAVQRGTTGAGPARVTVSVGVATYPVDGATPDDLSARPTPQCTWPRAAARTARCWRAKTGARSRA